LAIGRVAPSGFTNLCGLSQRRLLNVERDEMVGSDGRGDRTDGALGRDRACGGVINFEGFAEYTLITNQYAARGG
jgi:hypothetical protein